METEAGVPLLPEENDATSDVAHRTVRKLDWNFLPMCGGIVVLSIVDRANIGYAANDLCNAFHLTHEEYARGVSLFYVTHLVTQILGNTILKRHGAHLWFSCTMFFWGCVATLMGFMQNATHFYVLRALLGLAEGSTMPGIMYLLSMFYPDAYMAGAYSAIVSITCLMHPVNAMIAAGLMSLGSYVHVTGWRFLFVVEGITHVCFSVFIFFRLPASPERASFLQADEKAWIGSEESRRQQAAVTTYWQEAKTVPSHGVWWLASLSFMLSASIHHVMIYWSSLIVDEMLPGKSDDDDDRNSKTCGRKHGPAVIAVWLLSIPFAISGILCLLAKRYDFKGRAQAAALLRVIAGLCLATSAVGNELSGVLGVVALFDYIRVEFSASSPVVGLALSFFDVSIRSTASSLLSLIVGIGPVLFPILMGRLTDDYGYGVSISVADGFLFLAAGLIIFVKDPLSEKDASEKEANPAVCNRCISFSSLTPSCTLGGTPCCDCFGACGQHLDLCGSLEASLCFLVVHFMVW